MLNGMHTEQFDQIRRNGPEHDGHPSRPGHVVAGVDRLRSLLAAEEFFIATATELALQTTSPTEAAALALVVERAERRTAFIQILAAQGAQRTLAHELPLDSLEQLSAAISHPAALLDADLNLPEDPVTTPTGRLPHKNTADLLQHLLGIGFFEVRDRINAAPALLSHTDINGITQPARYPQLSADAQAGRIDPRHAIQAAKKLDKAAPIIRKQTAPAQLTSTIERQILESLRTQGPQATGKLITAWHRSMDEEHRGEPSAEEVGAKTGIFLTRRTEHFSYFSLCMLNLEAEVFLAHFANADNPRTAAGNRERLAQAAAGAMKKAIDDAVEQPGRDDEASIPSWADAGTPAEGHPQTACTDLGLAASLDHTSDSLAQGSAAEAPTENWQSGIPDDDGLTPARRRLHSILNALKSIGGRSGNGDKGLARATLVVHCRLEALLGLAEQSGVTAHGLEISPGELRRLLCDAGVLPIVFNAESQILDLGREQRFVPDYIRQAVLARDGGCLVPGCTVPPEHCEICHIDAWQDGGVTSAENSGPGCSAHHHDFHSGKLKLVRDINGLPGVLLPKYMDPEQIPRRNDHWQRRRITNPTLF